MLMSVQKVQVIVRRTVLIQLVATYVPVMLAIVWQVMNITVMVRL